MHTLFAALIESGQAAGELRTDLSAAQPPSSTPSSPARKAREPRMAR